jgi:Cu2+-exporting ATPase
MLKMSCPFGLQKMDIFWELIALMLIMILDYWFQIKSIAKASKDLALKNQAMPIEKKYIIQKGAFID